MFTRLLTTAALILTPILSFSTFAEGFQYEEGTHYVALQTPVKTRNPNVVEVTEYFSYGCPHCYRLEPLIQQFKEQLPEDVDFNRTPAIWQVPGYELYARTYYTALALKVLNKVHTPLFQALHAERKNLNTLEKMTEFMGSHGVDMESFVKTYNDSFGVKAQYQQAIARQRVYRSGGVPAIIVNGKYRVEASMVDHSNVNMLRVANFLIDRERKALAESQDVPNPS